MATWRRLDTMLPAVVTEAEQCALEMKRAGFHVVRVKIEATLANEEIPLHDADAKEHPAENYFEHHIKLLRVATASSNLLLDACEKHGAYLSRNAFRELRDGQQERFVTLRSYGVGRMSSEKQLQQLLNVLQGLQEQIIGCESEYCVYDTNVSLDAGWL